MTVQSVRCDKCSVEHPTGAGYVRRRGRTLCGSCVGAAKHRANREWGVVLWLLFGATAAAWLFGATAAIRFGLTNLSMIYAAGALTTAVHESGHALAALAMGIRVREVVLGSGGPQIFAISRGLFTVRLLLLPIGGVTKLEPATRAVRTRHIVTAIAGPLTELGLLIVVWSWHPVTWPATQFRSSMLILGAISIITNLVLPLRRVGNDGSKLWQLLTMPDDEVEAIAGMSKHEEIVRRLSAQVYGEPISIEELEEIRHFFVKRLSNPGLADAGRALESSSLAVVNTLLDRDDLLAEADELSEYAYENLPLPVIAAARGSVLMTLGREAEAVSLLERALPELEGVDADGARAELALAAIRAGDLYKARRYLGAIGRELNVSAYVEARRLLGPAELRNVLSSYWTGDRSPQQVADLVGRDAGADSIVIGHNIEAFLASTSGDELASLMADNAGVAATPEEATRQLEDLVDWLGKSPSAD